MKHMKRSMFITTIMMVVVLVVALSTATFAWYTSSNTVTSVATQVNSADATGANISIGWANNTPVGQSSLTFATQDTDYSPMVPTIASNATWANANFTTTLPFYTANLSYGSLENRASATPYVGKNASDHTTFYIVNYSLKQTDITFTCVVTGDNAARLRVAVFKTDGACVFTNADFYYGKLVDQIAANYSVLDAAPTDWTTYSTSYFTRSGEEGSYTYTAVALVAPTWRANTYYTSEGVLTTELPSDWTLGYANYSSVAAPFTAVKGEAPTFVASTYYRYNALTPEKLSAPGTISQISTSTRIAASTDGAVGQAQGFVVKAWYDGPTQVDAYGGLNATFALSAEAAVVNS